MGWITAAIIGLVAFAVLRLIGLPRGYGRFVVIALAIGAAGYAVQQRAALPGHPVTAKTRAIEVDPGMVAFRSMILPGTAQSRATLAQADADLRQGNSASAVARLLEATRRNPRDVALWTGLGSALTAHDAGQMSPAARFAFQRAWQIAPRDPGPPFFLGLALVQSGDLPAAKVAWLRALALAPRDAAYRVDIAERLVVIDDFQAMIAGEGRKP
ncbi:tetratricopeptide repeat protein [Sphingomonas radiodurans]|uniref:tetratricopeptide repeat protein n=1 Tax=Sphingomonas radiodurans TaxID=2890321 RepID=UPI001E391AA6|nr:tetratricopeptide repeat protein [Sphingomonas radiodurans]WBH15562.1 cytochrome C biosynthesis protein [Sphingomonas radiodurans]